jgi:hypothetical protein
MGRVSWSLLPGGSSVPRSGESSVPQALQKRAGSATAVPHDEQTVRGGPVGCATWVPHSRQNKSPRR